MTDLTGLNAVVTGGNAGIGRAMAIGIAKAGGAVSIWSRNADRNAEVVDEVTTLGGRAIAIPCDITDETAVIDAMERTVTELGPLGCFVANAGIVEASPIVDLTLESWRRVLATNLDGAFLCTREAARRFVAQDSGGSIIVLSSTISRYGGADLASYAASKTGVLGLARTLAVELARHRVRCNTLIPGWTRTNINADRQADDRFMAATIARTPMRRWADPDEFHEVTAFLADPKLTFHTGNEIIVDGGYTIY
ncbi:2-deoxy-D-gluconate 3-dehydrogenase [Mycolicibacterium chitae]|uniref:Short-chain dehydrogenase/reductase SDR n=1 Tax=Mycolicibacterium chitae TaxID=1792 RepID=A0A3S4TNT3_MYCCI|nr:SDR family oxidoreductase [Mycolicibacterium chitae]MCV7105087.1 SDR family oxidoreductase [Mycolicibacterium chitae]BBZ05632.1 2-deoxy-D-gluconate 3-dehydrogenase [Mycolicibacterium chitae]VEG49244.1 short-chain dehydrogenase/reductase SDR [Mycolicibacterium chitae]